jgi:hypothetical protein
VFFGFDLFVLLGIIVLAGDVSGLTGDDKRIFPEIMKFVRQFE